MGGTPYLCHRVYPLTSNDWSRNANTCWRGVFLQGQAHRCILHKCIARFISDGWVSCFVWLSISVQVTDWKDSSPKWPLECVDGEVKPYSPTDSEAVHIVRWLMMNVRLSAGDCHYLSLGTWSCRPAVQTGPDDWMATVHIFRTMQVVSYSCAFCHVAFTVINSSNLVITRELFRKNCKRVLYAAVYSIV